MASNMRNQTKAVALANVVAAHSLHARMYVTCAAAATETSITWAHNPVTGFAKKRQRPKETLL